MIEGDGIGPEIAQSVKDIFAAAKVLRRYPSYEVAIDDSIRHP